jgi:DNA-binding transcriptional ArsR family regulator
MLQHRSLDHVLQALADPTRRAIVQRLCVGSASVSELASPFSVSLSAIGQHLHVLEASGLVHTHKAGRVRTVELAPETLSAAERWFTKHRQQWEQRFDRLGALLAEDEEGATSKPRKRRK